MRCLLTGLTDMRSAFFRTSKVPNPWTENVSMSCNCLDIAEMVDANSSEVSFAVYPNLLESSDMNSLLFKI